MSQHEFGIINYIPVPDVSFDEYEPEKYNCIVVDDDFVEPLLEKLNIHVDTI